MEEGNSFNLSVKVTGTPFPFVSWLRKDVPLLTNDRVTLTLSGTVVLIKNAMLSDTGIFTANASAVGRWSSVSLEVTVYGEICILLVELLSVLTVFCVLYSSSSLYSRRARKSDNNTRQQFNPCLPCQWTP